MSANADETFAPPEGKFLVDPYENWARAEGVPIHRAASLDLLRAQTAPWKRFGVEGAICHLDGRDDFLTVFLYDLAKGAASAPMKHIYEEVFYVLSGHGTAELELPGGGRSTLEWRPKTLFSAPMNARIAIHNASGERARIAGVNDLRYLMSLYRNEKFLFENPNEFPARANGAFAVDCEALPAGPMARPNEAVAPIVLANGSIGCDLVEIAPGKYGRAARQMFGALMFGVAGEGMTLSWVDEPREAAKTPWRHGVAHAATGMEFHQRFNLGAAPDA